MRTLACLAEDAYSEAVASGFSRLSQPSPEGSDDPIALYATPDVLPDVGFARGAGVGDLRPQNVRMSWTDVAQAVQATSMRACAKSDSAWLLTGEVVSSLRGGPALSEGRDEAALSTYTLLCLDCDAGTEPLRPAHEALADLSMAHLLFHTWSSRPDLGEHRWRLVVPVVPETVDASPLGRWRRRMSYAWLAGLFAELFGMPTACRSCGGSGEGLAADTPCASCKGSGTFRFDLSCWNLSRLHYVGSRPRGQDLAPDHQLPERGAWAELFHAPWADGHPLDAQLWLRASGFPEWIAPHEAEFRASEMSRGAGDGDGHPDQRIAEALEACRRPMLERVKRAWAYVAEMPPSVSGRKGHDALMRAASAACSGFLVPARLAERVLLGAFNPRCRDLGGAPFPWSPREVRRKVEELRTGPGTEPGGLLGEPQPALAGRFYLSGGMAYDERGAQLSPPTWQGEFLALCCEAARLDGWSPETPPAGWAPRPPVLRAPGISSAAFDRPAGLDTEARLRREAAAAGTPIPSEDDWQALDEPVVVGADDLAAQRLIVQQMNRDYAMAWAGQGLAFLSRMPGMAPEIMRKDAFLDFQERWPLRLRSLTKKGEQGASKPVNRGDLWRKHPQAACYERLAFKPGAAPEDGEAPSLRKRGCRAFLNLFRGWPVRPNPRGLALCPTFRELVDEVICDGDAALSRWVWTWMAQMVQQPEAKVGVALALVSRVGGTGKGTLFRVLMKLLGPYGFAASSAENLLGDFNWGLTDKLLVFFDEAGKLSEKDANKLASMVTEDFMVAEQKYLDKVNMPSFHRFGLAMNNPEHLPLKPEDRRFCVVEVPPRRRGDHAWWAQLHRELMYPYEAADGYQLDAATAQVGGYLGYSGLMHHLLTYPVEVSLLKQIPQTKLRQRMLRNVGGGDDVESFLEECALRQSFGLDVSNRDEPEVAWPGASSTRITAATLVRMYEAWARPRGARLFKGTEFYRRLHEVLTKHFGPRADEPSDTGWGDVRTQADGLRHRWYMLPSAGYANTKFAEARR